MTLAKACITKLHHVVMKSGKICEIVNLEVPRRYANVFTLALGIHVFVFCKSLKFKQ